MQDAPSSVHGPPFDYHHPGYRAAAAEAKARSGGCCQLCGSKTRLDAHHWGKRYPPPDRTTAADLTALCRDCHRTLHLVTLFENAGGSPKDLCGAWSETLANLLILGRHPPRCPVRVGRPVWAGGQWVALVTGRWEPAIGEIFALFLRSKGVWRRVAVTEVLDGQPGCWRVRKQFLGNNRISVRTVSTEQSVPAATGQAAA